MPSHPLKGAIARHRKTNQKLEFRFVERDVTGRDVSIAQHPLRRLDDLFTRHVLLDSFWISPFHSSPAWSSAPASRR